MRRPKAKLFGALSVGCTPYLILGDSLRLVEVSTNGLTLDADEARRLRAWLDKAIAWMEEAPRRGSSPSEARNGR